ncbi:hypothetical protein BDB00DRAFT_869075 [Zychaea mexicana]|uniref:uncharacterized protein n=1 Tax=Zychaea mexicana TaxID=64656 RepID=UPI0022FE42DF|nr:uncharacterized protein BDB00DRAFT_869075 [Zychaea mexicana]KAI9496845.1 hypothetical protein BDB00DRAFT_869075 [Zychaea mexicana]
MQPRKVSAAPDTSDLFLTDDATASRNSILHRTTPTLHALIATTDTTPTDHDQDIFVSTPETILDDMRNPNPLQPWMYRGTNVTERFTSFKQAIATITTSQLLFIDPSVHELLAFSNIFLLCTSQHSPLCIDTLMIA